MHVGLTLSDKGCERAGEAGLERGTVASYGRVGRPPLQRKRPKMAYVPFASCFLFLLGCSGHVAQKKLSTRSNRDRGYTRCSWITWADQSKSASPAALTLRPRRMQLIQ